MNSVIEGPKGPQYIELRFSTLIYEDNHCVALFIRDITDKERAKKLQEQELNKTKALAAVSHEFRTPLNGIMAILETLQTKLSNDLVQDLVLPAFHSAKLLLFLVNDILDLHQV
jgi:signal transduction histidine kinase